MFRMLTKAQVKSEAARKAECYDCEAGGAIWLTATVEVSKENAML